jgi:hypothetical protein
MKRVSFLIIAFFSISAIKAQTKGAIHTLIQNPGQIITCFIDSSSLLSADTIKIYYTPKGSKYNEINMFCPNFEKTDSLKRNFMWPASIEFAEDVYFTYKYNRKQKTNTNDGMSVTFDASKFYFGKYVLDENNKTLELNLETIRWKRKFHYSYNEKNHILTLIKD